MDESRVIGERDVKTEQVQMSFDYSAIWKLQVTNEYANHTPLLINTNRKLYANDKKKEEKVEIITPFNGNHKPRGKKLVLPYTYTDYVYKIYTKCKSQPFQVIKSYVFFIKECTRLKKS